MALFLTRGRAGWRDVRIAPATVGVLGANPHGVMVDARFGLPRVPPRTAAHPEPRPASVRWSPHDAAVLVGPGWPMSDDAYQAGPAQFGNGEWVRDIVRGPEGWRFTVDVGAYLLDLATARVAASGSARVQFRDPWHLYLRPAIVVALRRWTDYATTVDGPTWFESVKVNR